MGKVLEIRNVRIGEGIPKICVPIVGRTAEEILKIAESLKDAHYDLVEWRVDWFESFQDFSKVNSLLSQIRETIGHAPLLFTFRTANEGGEAEIDAESYIKLNEEAIKSGFVDLIDIELFLGDDIVNTLVKSAHSNNVKVVMSNHDFNKTPDKNEIVSRLIRMNTLGADIPKIAVMPNIKEDVLALVSATIEADQTIKDKPIITMSMSDLGVISRLSGELTGSAVTFGSLNTASAPGQVESNTLNQTLNLIHECKKGTV